MRPRACDFGRLDRLLRGQVPDDLRRELEAHLLACPACRDRLDDLAGGPRWWAQVRRHLGGDGAAELSRTSDPAVPRPAAGFDLDFLQPSDNPVSLGRLGAYEVLEVLGQGGMGVVLKAFDPALHRPVAIKVLAADYAGTGAARKRFAREAQAAAAVSHDHVVPVHAVDAEATPPYLVMAFISGESLQQRLDRSGPLGLREILRIGTQTAAGLAAAHAQGIVHRDIKPANIMLENGIERVRITDFGLARAVDDASVSQSGAVAGTPQYMAPEQARGEAVDQRADLFALGSTLYAVCTGDAPFRGDGSLAVIRQVCDAEPAPIRSLNPDIPRWLEGIVRKLHAKDPAGRFASAGEVADLLEKCLAHVQQPDAHPLPAAAEELGRRVRDSVGRQRGWPVALLTATALGGVALFLATRPAEEHEGIAQGEASNSPAVAPPLGKAGRANFDEYFRADAGRLGTRLGDLRNALASAADEGNGLDAAFQQTRQHAEMVRGGLRGHADLGHDPLEEQMASIRRRLERLRQDITGRPE